MTHTSGNYSFKEPPFEDGDTVEGGNYTQLRPGTEICKSVTGLTILGGNFVNCVPPPGWKCEGGNWCQKDFCSHASPHLVVDATKACPVCKTPVDSMIHPDGLEEITCPNVECPFRIKFGRPYSKKALVVPCADDCEHRSAEKIERVVEEPEYREKLAEAKDPKASLSLDDLSIDKREDADGITVQTFKVRKYEYVATVVQTGSKVRKGNWQGVK